MIPDAAPGCQLSGTVVATGGAPQPTAVLTLCDDEGGQFDRTYVDPGGAYTLTAPRPGRYILLVQAPGHRPQAQVLALVRTRTGHDLALERLPEQVTGQVRAFPSGKPLAGAIVVVTDDAGEVLDSTRSGPDGRYAVGGLGEGNYTLTSAAHDMWPAAVGVFVPGSGRTITCDLDMLEPIASVGLPPAGESVNETAGDTATTAARWAAARFATAPNREPAPQDSPASTP